MLNNRIADYDQQRSFAVEKMKLKEKSDQAKEETLPSWLLEGIMESIEKRKKKKISEEQAFRQYYKEYKQKTQENDDGRGNSSGEVSE